MSLEQIVVWCQQERMALLRSEWTAERSERLDRIDELERSARKVLEARK